MSKNSNKQGKEEMEALALAIENRIKQDHKDFNKKTELRDVISQIIPFSPSVEIIGIDKDGDIRFRVPRKETGITTDLYIKHKQIILSSYVISSAGELILRENIDMFSDFIVNLNPDMFEELVNKWSHKDFGMDVQKEYILFKFHASLLQAILIESL